MPLVVELLCLRAVSAARPSGDLHHLLSVGETLRHLLLLHNRTGATELEPGWGRKGRGSLSRKRLLEGSSQSCCLVEQTLFCFNCFICQKKLSQDLRSPISIDQINVCVPCSWCLLDIHYQQIEAITEMRLLRRNLLLVCMTACISYFQGYCMD